jgi:hypothetical protein
VSGTFTLPPQASANVGNPPVGYYRFFIGDGSDNTAGAYYKKDSTGTVTPLVPASYTDEQAQDAIGALLADSNNIDVTYNDAGNIETLVWRNPWMGLVTGASKTYAATDIGGFYTRSNAGAAMTDTLARADRSPTTATRSGSPTSTPPRASPSPPPARSRQRRSPAAGLPPTCCSRTPGRPSSGPARPGSSVPATPT